MASTDNKPVITVLTAPDEERPPGLDPLFERASEVRFAWDAETLRQTLPGTHIMMVTDFRTEALREAWPCADALQWIHATSAGVDALMFRNWSTAKSRSPMPRAFSTGALPNTCSAPF